MPIFRLISTVILASLLSTSDASSHPAQACVSPPSNLVSWWSGDGHPNDIADGNDGTLVNGTGFGPGLVCQAFALDGDDDYVDVQGTAGLSPQEEVTVMAWVKTIGQMAMGQDMGIYDRLGSSNGFGLLLHSPNGPCMNLAVPQPGTPVLSINGGIGSAQSAVRIDDSQWHHIAGTYDRSIGVISVYVDGVLQGSSAYQNPIGYSNQRNQIGRLGPGGNGSSCFFDGLIDEVQVFDRALSDAEILAIFQADSAGVCKDAAICAFCFCDSGVCGNADPGAGCANSTGSGALLMGSGTTSVTNDDLFLEVTNVPPNQFGILFMGGGQIPPTPFGDGLLCVSPGPASFCRFPVQNSGPSGVMSEGPGIVAFSQTLQPACAIDPGETWNFQGWYRDPQGPCGGFFNLSNAVSVTFTP